MPVSLAPGDLRRLQSAINLAAKAEGPEAIAALRGCQRILEKAGSDLPTALAAGVSWRDAAPRRDQRAGPRPVAPTPRHEAQALELLGWSEYLTEWEKGFVRSVSSVRFPSERQKDTLGSIYRRVTIERRAGA